MRPRRHAPPHWWPAGEPWPPRGGAHPQWRGRSRFVRRLAVLFALLLFLSAVGAVSLASLVVSRLGGIRPGIAGLVVIVFVVVLLRLFVFGMTRVGMPLGDIVTAADRVADGDYTAQVGERGPPFLRRIARAFNGMTARLQAHDRQRRDLMADIAHELRTPLAVVQGKLEGLLDGVYERDDRQLGELLDETRLLSRLVEDLGALAQSERGAIALKKEPTDLGALLHDAVRSLAVVGEAAGVDVRADAASDLPAVNVDPLRLREVLVNLIANAVHHTGRGTQVVVSAAAAGDRVVITVSDTGPGMTGEELSRVFDRFQKGRQSAGSGLGLAIARNLVLAHGGAMTAQSHPGQGTTMRVEFPVDLRN